MVQAEPERLLKPGERVRLTEAPFAGIEGIYQIADGVRRVMVLIEILSKPVAVCVALASFRKAADKPTPPIACLANNLSQSHCGVAKYRSSDELAAPVLAALYCSGPPARIRCLRLPIVKRHRGSVPKPP